MGLELGGVENVAPGMGRRVGLYLVFGLVGVLMLAGCQFRSAGYVEGGPSTGEALYEANCASCHGTTGNRIPASPLSSKQFVDSKSRDQLLSAVAEGKGTMPAYGKDRGGPLTNNQVAAVVDYVMSPTGLEARMGGPGRDVYDKDCASCHGQKGDQLVAVPLNSQDFLSLIGEERIRQSIENGRGSMPGFGADKGGSLAQVDVSEVTSYLIANVGGLKPSQAAQSVSGAGKDLYSKNCASCHGDNGDQVASANLSSKQFLEDSNVLLLAASVADGKGAMPAQGQAKGGALTADNQKAILDYLYTQAGIPDGTMALAGKGGYDKFCVSCHGAKGDQLPDSKLNSTAYLNSKGDAALLESMLNGKVGMPAPPPELKADEARAVLAYMKAMASENDSSAKVVTNGQANAPKIPHEVAGREGKCLDCHGPSGVKPVPASHAGRTVDACLSCHTQ